MKITKELFDYLEAPHTVYDICAKIGWNYQNAIQKLSILEAGGFAKSIKQGRKKMFFIPRDSTIEIV
jgi:hypothetical protein